MPVPVFAEKHDEPSFTTASAAVEAAYGDDPPAVPPAVVLAFQESLFDAVRERHASRVVACPNEPYDVHVLDGTDGVVGLVGDFGIGAPVTAVVMEVLHAMGAETFCVLGGCGTLQPDVTGEHAIVVEAAVRDEGTSHHYVPPGETIEATPGLAEALERAARERDVVVRVGTAWTTDAVFRETAAEVAHYADRGVLAVDMEAAAVLAVARHHGLSAGAVFAAFDALAADEWEHRVDDTTGRLERLLPVVRDGVLAFQGE